VPYIPPTHFYCWVISFLRRPKSVYICKLILPPLAFPYCGGTWPLWGSTWLLLESTWPLWGSTWQLWGSTWSLWGSTWPLWGSTWPPNVPKGYPQKATENVFSAPCTSGYFLSLSVGCLSPNRAVPKPQNGTHGNQSGSGWPLMSLWGLRAWPKSVYICKLILPPLAYVTGTCLSFIGIPLQGHRYRFKLYGNTCMGPSVQI
jgi:hypothetical protein